MKKRRKVVWHKKSGKFIPAGSIRPKGSNVEPEERGGSDFKKTRAKKFAKSFSDIVKKAAKKNKG